VLVIVQGGAGSNPASILQELRGSLTAACYCKVCINGKTLSGLG